MIEKLVSYIKTQALFESHEPVLLAVSGGVDSTVMAHLFKKAGLRFGMAHINFGLRNEDSDEDAEFVKELANTFQVPFFSTRFDTNQFAEAHKFSIQMAARALRYQWLESTRKENQYHYIATAHHRDDAIETVLLNIVRGTGIHGLHGIRPKHQKIIRPMLFAGKQDIVAYAAHENIAYRSDASNLTMVYERNKLRLEVMPVIEKLFPSFSHTFSENIARWNEAGLLYSQQILLLKKKLLIEQGNEIIISVPKIKTQPAARTVLYELLADFGFTPDQSEMVYAALDAQPGKKFESATHQVIKDRNQLIIAPRGKDALSRTFINSNDRKIILESIQLKFEMHEASSFALPKDDAINCLDHEHLVFPLLLRIWKQGDYFYPLGLKKKKKKISDFLIDRKMPLHRKNNVWVVQSGERIACIVGERIDERFKVTANTKKIFVIKPETQH